MKIRRENRLATRKRVVTAQHLSRERLIYPKRYNRRSLGDDGAVHAFAQFPGIGCGDCACTLYRTVRGGTAPWFGWSVCLASWTG